MWKAFSAFDNAVYGFISGFITDDMTHFMKFVTFWGSEPAIAVLAAAIPFFALVFRKKEYYLLCLLASANIGFGALFSQILKYLFQRTRPDMSQLVVISGYSFPSGHTMNSLIFYGFVCYQIIKLMKHRSKYIIVAVPGVLILLIGISRVYLGVHYASDVLAGFIIGAAWLVFFVRLSGRHIIVI